MLVHRLRRAWPLALCHWVGVALALCLVSFSLINAVVRPTRASASSIFVERRGAKLFLGGNEFRWVGANSIQLTGCQFTLTNAEIDAVLSTVPRGSVIRTFAYQSLLATPAGIDRLVERARIRGVRLFLALTDGNRVGANDNSCGAGGHNADWYGGGWKGDLGPWIDALAAHLRNDPTVFGYEVINEGWGDQPGGCPADANATMTRFYDEAARRIKAADPNHLVGSGALGPQACGHSDYAAVHSSPAIDLVSFHSYAYGTPNGVPTRNTSANSRWINGVLPAAASLGKPAYIGEDAIASGPGCTLTPLDRQATDIRTILDSYLAPSGTAGNAAGFFVWQVTARSPADGCQFDSMPSDPQWNLVKTYSIGGLGNPTASLPGDGLVSLVPHRIVDSRLSLGVAAPLAPYSPARVQVGGLGPVPTYATAVQINATVVARGTPGFVTLYACDADVPLASNLNFRPGDIMANAAIVPLSSGAMCAYSNSVVDLVIDVTGYFGGPGTVGFTGATPQRLMDTRSGPGASIPGAGGTARLNLTEPPGATAVALVVTTTNASGPGFVTAYPCGSARPLASTVNPAGGAEPARANTVTLPVDPTRSICLFSSVSTDIVVDLAGWWSPSGTRRFDALVPTRLADTRDGTGGFGRLSAGGFVQLDLSAVVPVGGSVQLNLTAVGPAGDGYLTAWPCSSTRPVASVLNYGNGTIIAGATVATPDGSGQLCIYSKAATDLVVDLQGVFL